MSSLFHTNQLLIHEDCKETIKQVQGYEWDLKASQRGEDKPVKKDDHLVDSMRGPIMHDLTGKRILAGVVRL
jgi:phage terminase large subunit